MRHFIIGTAGHIDHGKTELVKALTGIDCDQLDEEKRRGITITPGYTFMSINAHESIGFVDVPGHHQFINNMIAGASGIDFAMLVIAADDSVMPQTIEHLRILEFLGIKEGCVVITKTDLVDEEVLKLCIDEVKELVLNTPLQNCQIFTTSTRKQTGIESLKSFLIKLSQTSQSKTKEGLFRLSIDRVFSVKGFGTVVTGAAFEGSLTLDETLYLLPTQQQVRIKRIHRYNQEVSQIQQGDRAALNLADINKDQIKKGMVLAKKPCPSTNMIDVQIRFLKSKSLKNTWLKALFFIGTFYTQVRIHLLNTTSLFVDDTHIYLAQIHLEKEQCIWRGDPFVIRSTSADITLGGGTVLDPHPLHHKKRTSKLIDSLETINNVNLLDYIQYKVRQSPFPIRSESISQAVNIDGDNLLSLLEGQYIIVQSDNDHYLLNPEQVDAISKIVIKDLEKYHQRNAFSIHGKTLGEFHFLSKKEKTKIGNFHLELILNHLGSQGVLEREDGRWKLPGQNPELSKADKTDIRFFQNALKSAKFQTMKKAAFLHKATEKNILPQRLAQILNYLVKERLVYKTDDFYLSKEIVDESRDTLLSWMKEHEQGISVAKYRDLINANRKSCIRLFQIFERERLIVRQEDHRYITDTGRHFGVDGRTKNST